MEIDKADNIVHIDTGLKVTPAQLKSLQKYQDKDNKDPMKEYLEFLYEVAAANGIRECVWLGRIPETGRAVMFTPAGQTAESTYMACAEGTYRMQHMLWSGNLIDPAAMLASLEDDDDDDPDDDGGGESAIAEKAEECEDLIA